MVGHTDRVWQLEVSAEFRRAVSGDSEGKLLLWNLETGGSQPLDGDSYVV